MSHSLDCSLFSLLPQKQLPWKQFLFSSCLQAIAVLSIVVAGLLKPEVLLLKTNYQFTRLVDPPPFVGREKSHLPATKPQVSLSSTVPKPAPVLVVRRELTPTLRPNPVLEAPTVKFQNPEMVLPSTPAVAPRLLAKTDNSSTGSPKVPTIVKARRLVQTGGFGDPNGVPAKAGNRVANIAELGSFDLPNGGGKGNGTGGAKGSQGVVASVGFGSGVATGGSDHGASRLGGVEQGGFGDANASAASGQAKAASSTSRDMVPAEILFKPNPVYTEEARKLHIEGEVLLEVVFQTSGTIDVLRVVHGLGHGLDESAIQAAQNIRFKPAMRDGQPATSSGILHVVFQLA